jgi:hypothetical protein
MKKQRPSDINQRAKLITDIATGDKEEPLKVKNPVAVDRGKKGGLKGGKARAEALSEKERKLIGLKAAHVRWNLL